MITLEQMNKLPKDNSPEWIIIHHSGGTDADPLADTSHHTFKTIQDYHLSLGWENIGYHKIVEKDGKIVEGRPEHYHGAHATNYNKKSIGIVLSGNFDVTLPTKAQEDSLRELLVLLMAKYTIPKEKIVPHRKFANKTCFGKKLSDTWAQNLLIENACDLSKFTLNELITEVVARLNQLNK